VLTSCEGGLDDADGAEGDLKARVTGKRSETTRRPSAKFLSTGFGQQVITHAATMTAWCQQLITTFVASPV